MRKLISIAVAAGMLATPGAYAQAQEAVYKPSGPWALDYGEDYCRLGRVFTDGKTEMELGIERIAPGPTIRIWIVGDGIKFFRGASEAGYTFYPAQSERKVQPMRSTRGGMQVLSLPELTLTPFTMPAPGSPPAMPARYDPQAEQTVAKGITAIGLGAGLTKPVRFDTGALDGAFAALQNCTDDLVKTWGVDPQKQSTATVPAIPQGLPWLAAGTIGFEDFAKFAGNANQVRLLIDAEGKPTKCEIAYPTLDESKNDLICKAALEKATFFPARDAGGQAFASYWMGSPFMMMPMMGGPGGGRR